MDKVEPKIFGEVESLKIEVATLNAQLLKEQERVVQYQQKIVDLTKENLQLRTQIVQNGNEKLFDELGIKGKVRLKKLEDSRYQLEPDLNGQAK